MLAQKGEETENLKPAARGEQGTVVKDDSEENVVGQRNIGAVKRFDFTLYHEYSLDQVPESLACLSLGVL